MSAPKSTRTVIRAVRTGAVTLIVSFLALFVLGCAVILIEERGAALDIGEARFSLGESGVYTEQERAEAAGAALEYMLKNWRNCKLLKLSYGKDPSDYDGELEYVRDLGSHHEKQYTQCIRFYTTEVWLCDNGVKHNGERDDYMIHLAREEDGDWEVVAWGYC